MRSFCSRIKYSPPSGDDVYQPPASLMANAHISGFAAYQKLYEKSLTDTDKFWSEIAKDLHFETKSDRGLEYNFDIRKGQIFISYMEGARTNVAYNCLERNIQKGTCIFPCQFFHFLGLGSKVAFIWEGNEPGDQSQITYQELLDKVINFSAVLRAQGIKKGDVVAIYLPMVFEITIAMLACARIGAIHCVVFAGFRYPNTRG